MDFGLFYYCQGRGVPHNQAYAEMLEQIALAEALGFGECWFAEHHFERRGVPTYCCAVSFAEIWAGVRPGEEAVTEAFFHTRSEVVLDAVVGRRAGEYLSRYSRSHGVQIADALVAAAASTAGLRLWTVNRRHYPMTDLIFQRGDRAPSGSGPADVARDVIRHVREPRAESANDGGQLLVELLARRVDAGQTFARGLGLACERGDVDRRQPAVLHDHPTADHHVGHGAAILGVDELIRRIVERDPVDVAEVEKHDVGLVAGCQPTDPTLETERPRAALRRP